MKHITKEITPADFEGWKKQANPDWMPAYENLQNPEKENLHAALLAEQGQVCCYCGRSVDLKNSHIEHFRPQNAYPQLELCYENLLASCVREQKPGDPLHCGHAKKANFDESEHISPLDPTCEQRFRYTLSGEIIASDASDHKAEYMRNLLALNTPFLKNACEAVLKATFDDEFLANATEDELQRLRDGFRTRDNAGKLPDYGHVAARYAEQLLERG